MAVARRARPVRHRAARVGLWLKKENDGCEGETECELRLLVVVLLLVHSRGVGRRCWVGMLFEPMLCTV